MALFPKLLGGFQRVDFESFPPRNLIASLVKLPMVPAAQRHRKFIADFKTDGSRLRKPQMMRIGGCRPQTRHGCEATNFKWTLSRSRLGSAIASWLLSILPRIGSGTAGAKDGATAVISFVFVRSDRRSALMEFWCRRP